MGFFARKASDSGVGAIVLNGACDRRGENDVSRDQLVTGLVLRGTIDEKLSQMEVINSSSVGSRFELAA